MIKGHAEGFFKTSGQRGFDYWNGHGSAQLPFETGNSLFNRFYLLVLKFFSGNSKNPQHFVHIEIDQNRPLKEDGTREVRSSCSWDLTAPNLDIVSRTEIGWNAKMSETLGTRFSHFSVEILNSWRNSWICFGDINLPAQLFPPPV